MNRLKIQEINLSKFLYQTKEGGTPIKFAGFTLIETLVALVVVAIALSALSRSTGQFIYQQSELQTRVVATWIAENRLIELQQSSKSRIEAKQKIHFMEADWKTEIVLEDTMIAGIKKVSVYVYLEKSSYPSAVLKSVVGE